MSKENNVIAPGGGITPGPHRIHPAYVVMAALQALVGIIIAIAAGLLGSLGEIMNQGLGGTDIVVIVAITGAVLVLGLAITLTAAYIYYKRFTWEITESDIIIRSGLFFKKQVHVPFQRVQSIDFSASIIQRIIGIVKLKIDTAGGSTNRGVLIPGIKLAEAEALRAEVFRRKKISEITQDEAMQQKMQEARAQMGEGTAIATSAAVPLNAADKLVDDVGSEIGGLRGVFADNYYEEAPVEYEHGLKAKELVLSALSGDHNLVIFAALVGLATQVPQLAGFLGLDGMLETAVESVLRSSVVPLIIGIIVFVFLITLVLGILNSALSYGGFKARRRGGRIEVERGLLSRQSRGVAIPRVQSVQISQGFIRRIMGYAELKLLTIDSMTAEESQQGTQQLQSGLVIHPFVKLDRVDSILAGIIPEFDQRPQPAEYKTLPKVAFRRVVNRHTILTALPYAAFALIATLLLSNLPIPAQIEDFIVWIIGALWGILVLIIIGRTIGSILWYKNAAYSYNKTMLLIRQGFYGRITTIIPRNKIQWAQTKQNPIQKMSNVANIVAVTAAGVSGTKTSLRDLDAEEASAYLDWIRPHGNRVIRETKEEGI